MIWTRFYSSSYFKLYTGVSTPAQRGRLGSSHDNGFSLPRRLGQKDPKQSNARSQEPLTLEDRPEFPPAQDTASNNLKQMSGDRQGLLEDTGPRNTYTNGSKFQINSLVPPFKNLIGSKQPCSEGEINIIFRPFKCLASN